MVATFLLIYFFLILDGYIYDQFCPRMAQLNSERLMSALLSNNVNKPGPFLLLLYFFYLKNINVVPLHPTKTSGGHYVKTTFKSILIQSDELHDVESMLIQ